MSRERTFSTVNQEIRLHALNLAITLHKERFVVLDKKDGVEPEGPIGDRVLTDAKQFAAWLKDGDALAQHAADLDDENEQTS